jgi:hypothetical protein
MNAAAKARFSQGTSAATRCGAATAPGGKLGGQAGPGCAFSASPVAGNRGRTHRRLHRSTGGGRAEVPRSNRIAATGRAADGAWRTLSLNVLVGVGWVPNSYSVVFAPEDQGADHGVETVSSNHEVEPVGWGCSKATAMWPDSSTIVRIESSNRYSRRLVSP